MSNEAGQQRIDALLGRALRDKVFREKLIASPADAAKETGLSEAEIQLIAGGLAIGGGLSKANQLMYCTEKTCNEKGGARVVIFSPDENFNPLAGVHAGAIVTGKTGG